MTNHKLAASVSVNISTYDKIKQTSNDNIKNFVYCVAKEHQLEKEDINKTNVNILNFLINNKHINKSKIVYKNDKILKILNVTLDDNGIIHYYKPKIPKQNFITDDPSSYKTLDISNIKKAIIA